MEFADGSVWGRDLFPWHFWHSAHSVPERASCGTEYARGAQNRLLWYAAHFQGHSVLKKGSCGTEGIFGAQNRLLWYGSDTQLLQG